MFGSSKKVVAKVENFANNVDIILGKTASLKGALVGTGVARVDGVFEGTISMDGDLFVGPNANITAEIVVVNATVSGNIKGNIQATGKVELLSTARVVGDISAKTIMIEEGACFKGQSTSGFEEEQIKLLENP